MIEISLKSSDLLYLSCAISEVANPRAVIQIIPGVKEHKSRYNEFIMELNNNGFNVSDKEIDVIYEHIQKYHDVFFDDPLGYVKVLKGKISDQNYYQILVLLDRYKNFLK